MVGSFFDGMAVKSGQTSPLKKCFLRTSSVGAVPDDEQRLASVLRAVVGDGREIADVIEVRVADEHRLELVLQLEVETARQRAGVDRKTVVEEERARSVLRSLTAVTADYA